MRKVAQPSAPQPPKFDAKKYAKSGRPESEVQKIK